MRAKLLCIATTTAAFFAIAANAAVVDITGITGKWTATTGTSVDDLNSDSIRWGDPATSAGKSGYDFDAASTPINNVAADTSFDLGLFTHLNRPIYPPSITSATLQVLINLSIDGLAQTPILSTFIFNHWETDNEPRRGNCANDEDNWQGVNKNGCADRVQAVLNLSSTDSFTIGLDEYVFTIEGFKVGPDTFDEFWTKEEKSNSATLRAFYTLKTNVEPPPPPSEVPLPAAGLLLFGAVSGLGMFARRRRN
ncbi:MAG: PEP-CTERM sorting domain-containing protein [Cereibacter sphaeroides]|uniref:PEP-CTERM sorting domain-containing protein n=1 Tax=Cereibacter sphaeroides TaxID=1063 RepID=A0A2W5S7N7_CERSP|nr:MAG: PEP-CTERM sorting domain-containing protein [Cereibacter sphaeroides]